MTKEQLAALLNGREYGSEMTKAEEADARKSGLVVVFGYSDDLCEFRGAINDEVGCYKGADIYLTHGGPLSEHADRCECEFCGYESAKSKASKIEAVWNKDGWDWSFKTDLPHASFDIHDDGSNYCRGIVFSMADLNP